MPGIDGRIETNIRKCYP